MYTREGWVCWGHSPVGWVVGRLGVAGGIPLSSSAVRCTGLGGCVIDGRVEGRRIGGCGWSSDINELQVGDR